MVGNPEEIDEAIEAPQKNGRVLNAMQGLQDYLFCKVRFSSNKKEGVVGQHQLIENSVIRPVEDSEKILLKTKMYFDPESGCCLIS